MSKRHNSQPDSDGTGAPGAAAVGEQLQRILSSPGFVESPRLSGFLRFVVEAKLAGQEDRIQEYPIGADVFGRGESFDPRIDSIVRVEARRLRDRLSAYYAEDGKHDPVTIQLPRRGYTPRFSNNGVPPPSDPGQQWSRLRRLLNSPRAAWSIALASVAACALLLLRETPNSAGDVVALSLTPPREAVLVTPSRGGGPVVSPDGSRIVFPVRNQNGEVSLYLRSMDRVQARRLVGTENAVSPFWSPDGSKIGFGAAGKLKAFDLRRDEVYIIAEVPNYTGGTWSNTDGGVIVVSTSLQPLSRIPAAGGMREAVLPFDPGEHRHRQPVFLPDGKRLLYTATRPGGSSYTIRVADLYSGESRSLLEANSLAQYAQTSDGRHFLVFSEGGTLSAHQVHPQTLELLSAGTSLVGGLPPTRRAFSVAGSTLAYFHGPYPISHSRLVWRSRSGEHLGVLGSPGHYVYVSLSPGERTVAATISSDHANVWTIDVSTGVATRQTEHPKLDRTPIWSPDASHLLISSNRDDAGRIYILAADGSAKAEPWLQYPTDGRYSDWPSHWHPNNSSVLFSRRAEGGHDIWKKDPGQPPELLIGGSGAQLNARLSPDQRYVAYASNELGEWQIFISGYPPTGGRIRISPDGGNHPLWAGNGRELFYVAPDGRIMSVAISAEHPLRASRPSALFQTQFPVSPSSTVYQYAVTNDGNRFLVVEEIEGPSMTAILNWERLLDR